MGSLEVVHNQTMAIVMDYTNMVYKIKLLHHLLEIYFNGWHLRSYTNYGDSYGLLNY